MPKHYSLSQIADAYGKPVSTTHRHIQKLIQDKKFEKKSIGLYNEDELKQLEKYLCFTYPRNDKPKPRQQLNLGL